MEIDGVKISGAQDRYLLLNELLQDYKFTTIYQVKNGLKKEHAEQQNGYVALLIANGFKVKKSEIVAILRDWSKGQINTINYPQNQVVVLDVPIWTPEKTLSFLRHRIKLHQDAEKKLPECTPEERWASATSYAIKKTNQKNAVAGHSNYGSEETARKILVTLDANHYIEKRPGKNRRCLDYCNVKNFCIQFQELSRAPLT